MVTASSNPDCRICYQRIEVIETDDPGSTQLGKTRRDGSDGISTSKRVRTGPGADRESDPGEDDEVYLLRRVQVLQPVRPPKISPTLSTVQTPRDRMEAAVHNPTLGPGGQTKKLLMMVAMEPGREATHPLPPRLPRIELRVLSDPSNPGITTPGACGSFKIDKKNMPGNSLMPMPGSKP